MATTTKWFPHTIKPVRAGMYQTLCNRTGAELWRYWNGTQWGWGYKNKRWAYSWRNEDGGTQTDLWRGLAAPSNDQAKGPATAARSADGDGPA